MIIINNMEDFKNKIINEDCLGEKGLKSIPDNSIDLILCDLPYESTRLKWDKLLPLNILCDEYLRIIKEEGAIVLFGKQPFSSKLVLQMEKYFKYNWIWEKTYQTGFLNAHYRPMISTEDILVFSKSGAGAGNKNKKCMIYNPQGLIKVNKVCKNNSSAGGKVVHETNNVGENNILNTNKEYIQEYKGYPNNILIFGKDKPQLHPTQKPLELIKYLIKTYTNKNAIILDNCIGSGTTAIATIECGENRSYIGYEVDKKYFDITQNRINIYMNKQ